MSHNVFIFLCSAATIAHTHVRTYTHTRQMSIFIFLPMSNENFSLIFFSAIRNFACQLFYQPHSPSVNCVNSNKIYTMFYNNLPFKLNFSKWNRISLTWSSFAFSCSPPTNPSPCEFSVYTFFSFCVHLAWFRIVWIFFFVLHIQFFQWIIQNCIFITKWVHFYTITKCWFEIV